MVMSLSITIRLKLSNHPGTLAKVLTVIAREGGSLGAIDLISASPSHIIRELMIRLRDRGHLDGIVKALGEIPEVQIIHVADRAFPGVFKGALDCQARTINDEMCLAAAYALAGIITGGQLSSENIIPSVFNEDVAPVVAKAVEKAAERTGVSRKNLNRSELSGGF